MSLGPDKAALAVLYYLDSVPDAADDPEGISAAIGSLFTPNQIRAALDHLHGLGLVINVGPLPIGHNDEIFAVAESWSVTHEGGKYVYRCIRKPSSFIARLHNNGLMWLATDEARKATLSTKLDSYSVQDVLEEAPSASPPAVHIHNSFSPTNTVAPVQTVTQSSSSATDPHSKSAARAGWANVWVAVVIGLAAMGVAIWLAGKFS